MFRVKKRAIVGSGVLLILLISGVASIVFWRVQEAKKDNGQLSSDANTPKDAYGLVISSVEEIERLGVGPEEKHSAYIQEASKHEYVGQSSSAFEYYSKANDIPGINETTRQSGNYAAYRLAQRINDNQQLGKYIELLGGEAAVSALEENMVMIDEGSSNE